MTRLQDELDLQFVSIFYKPQIFSYGTQPVVLFFGFAESFGLLIFCLLLLLVIALVDVLLAAPSSYLISSYETRGLAVSKSKEINWRVKLFLS